MKLLKGELSTKKIKCIQRFVAFTLAEVLITLGVVGVVAALVIPPLMNVAQDAIYASGFKKNYSILAQALTSICNDNNGVVPIYRMGWENGITRVFLQYLNYSKKCNDGIIAIGETSENPTPIGVCWHPLNTIKQLDGTVLSTGAFQSFNGSSDDGGVILADGSLWLIDGAGGKIMILMDVNGFKPPNQMGRDIFGAKILNPFTRPNLTPFAAGDDHSVTGLYTAFDCTLPSTFPQGNGGSCGQNVLLGKSIPH